MAAVARADSENDEPRRLPTARVTAVQPAELPEQPSSFATVIETDDYEGAADDSIDGGE